MNFELTANYISILIIKFVVNLGEETILIRGVNCYGILSFALFHILPLLAISHSLLVAMLYLNQWGSTNFHVAFKRYTVVRLLNCFVCCAPLRLRITGSNLIMALIVGNLLFINVGIRAFSEI
jgi:hypothetical protein